MIRLTNTLKFLLTGRVLIAAAPGLIIGALAATPVHADKPPLDFNAFDDWPSAEYGDLSTDGRYALYVVNHRHKDATNTVVIQAVLGSWKMETEVSGSAQITRDGRAAVFIQPPQTLCLVTLGTSKIERLPGIRAFKLVRRKNGEWLVYQPEGSEKLVFHDITTGAERSFADVAAYWLGTDGDTLLIQSNISTASDRDHPIQSLQWVRVSGGAPVSVWRGHTIDDLTIDARNIQMAWTSTDEGGDISAKSLWYYRAGLRSAVPLVGAHSATIDDKMQLESISGFSQDGERIFVNLSTKVFEVSKHDTVKVDIWSYKDAKLQSQQLAEQGQTGLESGGKERFLAVVSVNRPHVLQLEQHGERIILPEAKDGMALLSSSSGGNHDERNWNPASKEAIQLISTKNGLRRPLPSGSWILSPDGQYVLIDDTWKRIDGKWQRDVSSYEIATGSIKKLMTDVDDDDDALPPLRRLVVSAWMDRHTMLTGDHYDIWKVDIRGRREPFNVTNGYGRRHGISLKVMGDVTRVANGDKLLLTAFDERTKESGFYSAVVGSAMDPMRLSMAPYNQDQIIPQPSQSTDQHARIQNGFLVKRSSAAEAPNYFYTRDFTTFSAISHVNPERAYNWLTSELLSWKTPDGRTDLGVLYKPEDFDPSRKYPVVFQYYERRSDRLNWYLAPYPMSDELPIPWFVSHGYLVFTPDIHYTIGHPGKSVLETLVSAANYLGTFPWVDAKKMGLQGHSWGGFETNYVVSHTDMFSAAMSSSGVSDSVSDYDALDRDNGASKQYFYEVYQSRIGQTLWQRPDLFIENSPLFQADKVNTPLLLMNNKEDPIVPFTQGVEFFVALRRLGKKVWMLQYDGEGHTLADEQAQRQHTIRVSQFFDYYLKGAPPPLWMTEGVPARLKGLETGLEIDGSGKEP